MFLDFLDPIDREIILSQEFEKKEINFLMNQIEYNNINYFIDVGANCGYSSLKISKYGILRSINGVKPIELD